MRLTWEEDEEAAAVTGMLASWQARRRPHDTALYSRRGNLTFAELDARANQFSRACTQAGLRPGDAVAILAGNVPEFIQVVLGCLRSGLRLTPVSWRFEPHVISHILSDCEAKMLVVQPSILRAPEAIDYSEAAVRLSIGGGLPGFDAFEIIHDLPAHPPVQPEHGQFMLYTSGTTGLPKGVRRNAARIFRAHKEGSVADYRPGDINLLVGPAYHGAPLFNDILAPMMSGVPLVMRERFDALEVLETIQRYRITHTHMVATMFHRLLALPDEVRARYDLSSLRHVIHGAAPTPPGVKQAMIEWLGPILTEYYAATEGSPGLRISSEEWLRKPGSVGKVKHASAVRILDADGKPCAPGVAGDVFLANGSDGVSSTYHRNEAETARVFSGDHFCVGDVGYIDEDGYLFLTGRTADRIISGGVNIQPLEIETVLAEHPDVVAACCVGAPNSEWGEEVKAVVVAHSSVEDLDALGGAILAWASERLAAFKIPRSIEFVSALPYNDAGKLLRAQVRDSYWRGRERVI